MQLTKGEWIDKTSFHLHDQNSEDKILVLLLKINGVFFQFKIVLDEGFMKYELT